MTKNKLDLRFGIVALMIVVAAISRFLPHPPNFTPVGGMALFGAAYFAKKYWAYLIPILAIWLSDVVLNNTVLAQYHEGFTLFTGYAMFTYIAIAAMVFLGAKVLTKIKLPTLVGASIGASLLFFLITNFGVWYLDTFNMYADDLSGLLAAYTAGLPFLTRSMVGDLFYVGVLFGTFEFVKSRYPNLQIANA